jgi:hypothetical protein
LSTFSGFTQIELVSFCEFLVLYCVSNKIRRSRKKQFDPDRLMEVLDSFPEWQIQKHVGPYFSIHAGGKKTIFCYSLQRVIERLIARPARTPDLSQTNH